MLELNQTGKQNLIEFIVEHSKGATVETATNYVESLTVDWDCQNVEVLARESKDGHLHVWSGDEEDFDEIELGEDE